MSSFRFQSDPVRTHAKRGLLSQVGTVRAAVSTRPLVVMVGTHLTRTRGGITTLNANILDSSLTDCFEIRYIASQAEDFGKARKLLLAIGSALRFAAICLFGRPAIAYVHIGSNASLYRESVFVVLASLFDIKVLSHFHAGDIDEYLPAQMATGRRFISWAINLSDRFIAVSGESQRQLAEMVPGDKIALIPNALNIEDLFVDRSHADTDDNRPLHILFVGAMGKLKGERDLVDALKVLSARGLSFRASFVGHGAEDLRDDLRHLASTDQLGHIGPVPMSDRKRYFESADIFVLPTYAEAMPMSVIEAMAAGLPVISTTAGGIPELIDHGVNGLLVEPGDVDALANAISFLINDPEARKKIGERAHETICRNMDFEDYIERLRQEIQRLIDHQDRPGSDRSAITGYAGVEQNKEK